MSKVKSTEQKTTVKKTAVEKSLESLIRKVAKEVNKEFYEQFLIDEIYKISRRVTQSEIEDDYREKHKYSAYDAESLQKCLQKGDGLFSSFYEDVSPSLAKKQAQEIYKALGVEWDTPLFTKTGYDWQTYPLWHLPKTFVESHKKLVKRLKEEQVAKRKENPENATMFPKKVFSSDLFKAAGLEVKFKRKSTVRGGLTTIKAD